ncbi:MAG: alpha/beta hydrolase [Desulfobulbaceae bacterium]|nr:alpha/beta hydrolase [Desulfobulbaceae bacterium]
MMHTITAKEIRIGKGTVHCLTAGNRGCRDILLLHGMKFNTATWHNLGTLHELAAAGFHAVAIDLPGFGKSPAGEAEHTATIKAFIQAEQLDRPVLVGPSMGGRVALEFTLDHPHLVDGLVLVGSVGVTENQKRLAAIKVPTLVVWGGDDAVSPLADGQLLAKEIPGARLVVIDNAPHPCYLDQPERWHRELLTFLSAHFG